MTVQKELTKNIYVGNGQTTKFPFTFECPDNHPEYIRVYVAGKKNELTETTNFGVDMANKSITYPANGEPLAIDEQLVIMRELPVRQLMNLVNNGPYFAEDIETAFDEGIMIAQQSSEKLGRALVAPPTSTTFDTQIPIEPGKTFRISDDGTHLESTEDPGKVYEASKGFAEAAATSATNAIAANKEAQQANEEVKQIYNNGMLTPISDLAGSIGTELKRWGTIFANKVFASNLPLMYNSVSDMKSDRKLKAGMTACTLGYYSPNDGGASTYIIRAKQDDDVDDGGSLHEISSKLVAELVVENGTVCPEQFGARGDGVSDDSKALRQTLAYSNIYVKNTYLYADDSTQFYIGNNKHIWGTGTIIMQYAPEKEKFNAHIVFNKSENVIIDGVTFKDADNADKNVVLYKCKNVNFINAKILNDFSGWNFNLWDCTNCTITNCYIVSSASSLYNDALHITGKNITIIGNYIYSGGDDGIAIGYNPASSLAGMYPVDNKKSENIIVTNNTVFSYSRAFSCFTINNETTINTIMCKNNILNGRISICGEGTKDIDILNSTQITGVIIEDNHIDSFWNYDGKFINLGSCDDITFSNNVIYDTRSTGNGFFSFQVGVKKVVISENVITGRNAESNNPFIILESYFPKDTPSILYTFNGTLIIKGNNIKGCTVLFAGYPTSKHGKIYCTDNIIYFPVDDNNIIFTYLIFKNNIIFTSAYVFGFYNTVNAMAQGETIYYSLVNNIYTGEFLETSKINDFTVKETNNNKINVV